MTYSSMQSTNKKCEEKESLQPQRSAGFGLIE
jgi:hypothetical protein